jgi:uncharacterized protein YndB with AHSA1/START domain
MKPHTVELHRVLRCPPERVYRAFLDPAALCKWLPPNGFTCTVHELEARVGGGFRMSFSNLASGEAHAFGGRYLVLEPGRRLQYIDVFDDPNLPGQMTTTVELEAVSCGCSISVLQEGIPPMIPTEMCYLGWQDSLRLLALLVEGVPGG